MRRPLIFDGSTPRTGEDARLEPVSVLTVAVSEEADEAGEQVAVKERAPSSMRAGTIV